MEIVKLKNTIAEISVYGLNIRVEMKEHRISKLEDRLIGFDDNLNNRTDWKKIIIESQAPMEH